TGAAASPSAERDLRAGLVPALTILYHPCLDRVGERAVLGDLTCRDAVGLSRTTPVFAPPGAAGGVTLGDSPLSRQPLRIVAPPDGQLGLDPGDSPTHVAVDGARLERGRDFSPAEVASGVVVELGGRIVLLLHLAREAAPEPGDCLGLVGDN